MIWDSSLETGDAAVDHQHRAIYGLFNELEASANDPAALMRALDFLSEYVLVHFAMEESLIASAGFPEDLAAIHLAEHAKLTQDVREHVLSFRTGELSDPAPLVEFLREWLGTHVHERDRLLVEFLSERGISAELSDDWRAAEQTCSDR